MTTLAAPAGRSLHVLTITPFYPKAGHEGAGCFVAEPLLELTKTGTQCTVFAVEPFYRPTSVAIPSPVASQWLRYAALPGGLGLASAGTGAFLRLRGPASRLHASTPIDLIHAHGALPCGHAAALLSRHLGIPFVVTVHGLDAFSTRQVSGRSGESCRKISRRVYAAARRVIGVSQRVCDEVRGGSAGRAALSVVYNGVDPSPFSTGDEPPQPALLTVGNLIRTKGHELVVEALAALAAEYPALTWEVIGEGPERERIHTLAERLGVLQRVRFLGRQDRTAVAEAFRRCTLFVLPSGYEGLGCVYLEAMASGKVALGCQGQGIAEIIRHGENGWLVPPDGREELISGLRVLLQNEARRSQIGAAARQTVLQSLTLTHQARQLLSIYRETAG